LKEEKEDVERDLHQIIEENSELKSEVMMSHKKMGENN